MSISNYAVVLMLFILLLLVIILVSIAAMFVVLYKHNKRTPSDDFASSPVHVSDTSEEPSGIQNIVQLKDEKPEPETVKSEIIAVDKAPNVQILPQQQTIEQIDFDNDDEIEDENILAVIAAAVAYLGMNNGKKYSIRSIRRVKRSPLVRSAWANSGIMQNTQPF